MAERCMTIPLDWRDAPAIILLRKQIGHDPRLYLLDMWAWQARQDAPGRHASAVLEAGAGWRGPAGALAAAMAQTGWIAGSADAWVVLPWGHVLGVDEKTVASDDDDLAEWIERRRASGRERAKRFRERRRQVGEAIPITSVTRIPDSVTGDVTGSVTSVTNNAPLSSYDGNYISIKNNTTEQRESGNVTRNADDGDDLMAQLFDDAPAVEKPRSDIDMVWQAYADTVPRVRFTKQRRDLIKRRLKEYTVDDLCRSIRGYGKSAWHSGENDRGIKYQTLELWLRDAAHVEAGWRYGEQSSGVNASMKKRGLSGIEETWDAYESSK